MELTSQQDRHADSIGMRKVCMHGMHRKEPQHNEQENNTAKGMEGRTGKIRQQERGKNQCTNPWDFAKGEDNTHMALNTDDERQSTAKSIN